MKEIRFNSQTGSIEAEKKSFAPFMSPLVENGIRAIAMLDGAKELMVAGPNFRDPVQKIDEAVKEVVDRIVGYIGGVLDCGENASEMYALESAVGDMVAFWSNRFYPQK